MKRTMQLTGMATILFVTALLTGCASISVNYDYDTSADFTQYKSFSWMPMEGRDVAGGAAMANNGLLSMRVQSSVDAQMNARGLQKADGDSDLLLAYHFGATDKIQVSDWGYNYSGYYGHGGYGYGGRNIDVYQYTEGTLLIDIVDAATNTLIWRGTGTGVVDSGQKSPEKIQANVDKAVAEIMVSFPPRK
jgi:hypothetical protein